MNSKMIVKEIMSHKKVKQSKLAKDFHISREAMFDRLRVYNDKGEHKDFNVKVFSQMLKKLGYKLVVVPSTTDVAKPEWYEVN